MLTTAQHRLIAALLSTAGVGVACKKAKVSTRSWCRWKNDPEFVRELAAARKAAMEDAVGMLQGSMPAAVKALRRCLRSRRPQHVIRAALGILDRGTKGTEFLELAAQVEELRQLVESRK